LVEEFFTEYYSDLKINKFNLNCIKKFLYINYFKNSTFLDFDIRYICVILNLYIMTLDLIINGKLRAKNINNILHFALKHYTS